MLHHHLWIFHVSIQSDVSSISSALLSAVSDQCSVCLCNGTTSSFSQNTVWNFVGHHHQGLPPLARVDLGPLLWAENSSGRRKVAVCGGSCFWFARARSMCRPDVWYSPICLIGELLNQLNALMCLQNGFHWLKRIHLLRNWLWLAGSLPCRALPSL